MLTKDLQFQLRKRKYDFSKSEKVLQWDLKGEKDKTSKFKVEQSGTVKSDKAPGESLSCVSVEDHLSQGITENGDLKNCDTSSKEPNTSTKTCGPLTDEDIVAVRREEKKAVSNCFDVNILFLRCSPKSLDGRQLNVIISFVCLFSLIGVSWSFLRLTNCRMKLSCTCYECIWISVMILVNTKHNE